MSRGKVPRNGNAPQSASPHAPKGQDKGQQQNTNRSQQRSNKPAINAILTLLDEARDTMATLAIELADLARDRQTAPTARMAVNCWQLACGVCDLGEGFNAWWELEEVVL